MLWSEFKFTLEQMGVHDDIDLAWIDWKDGHEPRVIYYHKNAVVNTGDEIPPEDD